MVFSKGYNRRDSKWVQPLFKPLPLGATRYIPANLALKKSTEEKKVELPKESTPEKDKAHKPSVVKQAVKVQKPLIISEVRDPKNQLSSLIKNASKNKKSLDERNKRIQKSKQQSKSRYGW